MSERTIKPIHAFGPPVGKWTVHGTVADTIAREKKRLKQLAEQQKANSEEAARVVKPMVRPGNG